MYNQGYGQNYNQGYPRENYNQGYPSQNNPTQGYNQPGYPQAEYQQGYQTQAQGQDIDQYDNLPEDWSIEQYATHFLGDNANRDIFSQNFQIEEAVGQRDLEGFDVRDLESNASQFDQMMGSGDRGLFSGGSGKSPLSHRILAGAAGYYAMQWFNTRQKKQGKQVKHGMLRKLAAALAVSQALKYWEKSGGWQSGISREVVAQQAARDALMAVDTKAAQDNQPQYSYNDAAGYGEAASFDNFDQQGGYQGGHQQGGYQQGGYQQGYGY